MVKIKVPEKGCVMGVCQILHKCVIHIARDAVIEK